MNKLASIIVLTYNSEKYIENCLKSILGQTYKNIELIIVDNYSKDSSVKIIENWKLRVGNCKFIENSINLGYAKGNNLGINESEGEYAFIINPDVVLEENYIAETIKIFEKDSQIGSVQGKIYQLIYKEKTKIIDTVGFRVFESGRVIDEGQGEQNSEKYNNVVETFGVNGAAAAYRRETLNDVRLKEEYFDEDFFCYAEDLDLAWRAKWRGWKCVFCPEAVLWHDRTSSKSIGGGWKEFRKARKLQSLWMRRISWRNMWFTYIKNLSIKSFLNSKFLKRQIKFSIYLLIFEPRILLAKFSIIKLLPKILKKRKLIMKNKKVKYVRLN